MLGIKVTVKPSSYVKHHFVAPSSHPFHIAGVIRIKHTALVIGLCG